MPPSHHIVARAFALSSVLVGGCMAPLGPDDVAAEYVVEYVHDGRMDSRREPHTGDLVAWVPSPDGWVERAFEKRDQGAFFLPDVPHARYFLKRGDVFYDTDRRELELSARVLGEPTQGMPYAAKLAVEAKNARFYQGPATVCLTSVRAGLSGLCFGWQENPYSDRLELALELSRASRFLPNADVIRRGDDVLVHQLDLQFGVEPVLATYSAARAFSTWDFDMTAVPDGVPATLTGSMYELLSFPFNYTYDRRSFEGLAPEVHPDAVVLGHQPSIEGGVRTPAGEFALGNGPVLFIAVLSPGEHPVTFPALYGNPLGRTWTPFVRAASLYARLYALPGSESPAHRQVAVAELGDLDARDRPVLAAEMSPARNITIDGQPFAGDVTVSRAPLLQWDTPWLGEVASYELTLFELTDTGRRIESRRVASFHTRERTLQLPDGVLRPGVYHAVLQARNGDAWALDRTAWHALDRFPFASAPAMSGLLTVQ